MYRQFDGYPSGHGIDLSSYLKDRMLVNGLRIDDDRSVANGMGCLAASIIAHFKDEPGGIYLYPPAARNAWEEYIYTVYTVGGDDMNMCGEIMLKVQEVTGYKRRRLKTLYHGKAENVFKQIKEKQNV
jgi:hypothetical protein